VCPEWVPPPSGNSGRQGPPSPRSSGIAGHSTPRSLAKTGSYTLIEIGASGPSEKSARVPRLRASPRHGGATLFSGDFIHSVIRRGGAPSGAAALLLKGVWGHQPPSYFEKGRFDNGKILTWLLSSKFNKQ
jgi:hypothetical protein